MREFFSDLAKTLSPICPTFLHVPSDALYPYITIEPAQSLYGLPWGPTLLSFYIKIWSRYAGTKEILKAVNAVQTLLNTYPKASLKVIKSSLTLLTDEQTRVHTFQIKARLPYERN